MPTMPATKTPAKPARRPPRKAAPRPVAAKPAAVPPAPAVQPAKAAKPAKAPKLRKKPVRDSFTMPEADFALIATLKARALSAQRDTKKSELLRAGLHVLVALETHELLASLEALDPVKIGRPKAVGR